MKNLCTSVFANISKHWDKQMTQVERGILSSPDFSPAGCLCNCEWCKQYKLSILLLIIALLGHTYENTMFLERAMMCCRRVSLYWLICWQLQTQPAMRLKSRPGRVREAIPNPLSVECWPPNPNKYLIHINLDDSTLTRNW